MVTSGVVASIRRENIRWENIRQILQARATSLQATKTWKSSPDPDFIAKMRRVLDLHNYPLTDGRGGLRR